jgi:hypothetical protein
MITTFQRLQTALLFSLLLGGAAGSLAAHAHPATARPSTVTTTPRSIAFTVHQVPGGAVQKTTCTDPQNCSLDLTLQTGSKKETLAVRAFCVPGSTLFTFHTPDGYLYAAAKTQADPKNPVYMATWGSGAKIGAAAISDITLYGPPVPIAMGAKILSAPPGPAVADLQVTVEAAP